MKRINGIWYLNGYGRPFFTLRELIVYLADLKLGLS
jgi:hypothetical protein